MRNERFARGGLLLLGLATLFTLPKVLRKGRHAMRRATGITHRSGPSSGRRATADPARGFPA